MKLRWATLALLLLPSLAMAQSTPVYQGGLMTAPHDLAKITRNGQVQDAGGLLGDINGRGVNPFAIQDNLGIGLCSNTASTGGSYHSLCIGHDGSGSPIFTVDTATYPFLGLGNGNVIGPNTTAQHNIAAWNNAGGTLLADPAQLTTTFTNTQMNEYAVSALNGLNPSNEFHSEYGFYATDALFGGVAVPNTSTVGQANGISAIVTNASPSTNTVAVFGMAKAAAASTTQWGANFLCDDESHAATCLGIEVDTNIRNTSSIVNGVSALGASPVQPASATAFVAGYLDATSHGSLAKWTTAFAVNNGAATNGISIGTTAFSGNNLGSMPALFTYTNGSGTFLNYELQVSTAGILQVLTTAGSGMASFFVDGSISVNALNGTASSLAFDDAGVTKWLLSRAATTDTFNILDVTTGNLALAITTGGAMTLGETGKSVSMVGTVNLGSTVTAAPSTGTPAASLCLDAGGNIIKKTTSGACI